MINLIKADLYKEIRKKSFKIILLLIVFVSILSLIVINKNINLDDSLIETYPLLNEEEYKNVNKYGSYKQYVSKYQEYVNFVENENSLIKINHNTNLKYILNFSYNFIYLIGILVIYLAFHSYSYDFLKESLKYVYMSRYSRIKVYLSKMISVFILTVSFVLILVVVMLITSCLLTGENIFNLKEALFINNIVKNVPYLIYYLSRVLMFIFPLLFILVFTEFLSILFKGSNIGIIISGILYFTSLLFSQILLKYGFNFIDKTFLPYLDFTYFIDNVTVITNNMIYNLNLKISNGIIVLGVYAFLFILLSLRLLKKDV